MKQIIEALNADPRVSDYKINMHQKESYELFFVKGKLETLRRSQHVFLPLREEDACAADYRQWRRAVERSRMWIENEL